MKKTMMGMLGVLGVMGVMLAGGCMTGNDAVPSTVIKWNPSTGQTEIKAPKNSKLEGFEINRSGTNVTIKLTKGEFDNDPNVVGAAYAGQAAMVKETMALAEKMVELGVKLGTGQVVAPKVPSTPEK